MLRRVGVRGKILATLAVPIIVLFLGALVLSAAMFSELRDADVNGEVVDTLDEQAAVTKALQVERSAAVEVLGSSKGAEDAFEAAIADTDGAINSLDGALGEISGKKLDNRLESAISQAWTARSSGQISSVRNEVTGSKVTVDGVLDLYGKAIEPQLNVSGVASERVENLRLAELLSAFNTADRALDQHTLNVGLAEMLVEGRLDEEASAQAGELLAAGVRQGEDDLNRAADELRHLDVSGAQLPGASGGSPILRAGLGETTSEDKTLAEESSWAEVGAQELGQIRQTRDAVYDEASDRAGSIRSDLLRRGLIAVGIAGLAIIVSIAVALLVARRITEPLRRLTTAANEVRQELPRLVEQVAVPGQDPQLEFASVPVQDEAEIGQLATAFNGVNERTLEIAREQALLRGSIAEMFVNVASRDQALLSKQLMFLDELERSEEDPSTLANLFRIDHFATRMRRNAESLLVLAGIESGRRVREPMSISDVVRTASSEIEHYDRIEFDVETDPLILGHNALITAHLLAELLENATNFSEPAAQVQVQEFQDAAGVMIEITDAGPGMSQEELEEAHRRTSVYAGGEIVGAQRLGLYVVGRLAHQLGATVQFTNNAFGAGGVLVRVHLPAALFATESDQALPEPTDPLRAENRAATEAWAAPSGENAGPGDPASDHGQSESSRGTLVENDAPTWGLTDSGMLRRRFRVADPSQTAPSAMLAGGLVEDAASGGSPVPVTAFEVPGVDQEWNPISIPSDSTEDFVSHEAATEVGPEIGHRAEYRADSEAPGPVPYRPSMFEAFRTTQGAADEVEETIQAEAGSEGSSSLSDSASQAPPTRAAARRAREVGRKRFRGRQSSFVPMTTEPAGDGGLAAPGLVGGERSYEHSKEFAPYDDESVEHLIADQTAHVFFEEAPVLGFTPDAGHAGPNGTVPPSVAPQGQLGASLTVPGQDLGHEELPAFAELVGGSPRLKAKTKEKAPRRRLIGRKGSAEDHGKGKRRTSEPDEAPAVGAPLVGQAAFVPMFEPEDQPPVWHQAGQARAQEFLPLQHYSASAPQEFPRDSNEYAAEQQVDHAETWTEQQPNHSAADELLPGGDFYPGHGFESQEAGPAPVQDQPEGSWVPSFSDETWSQGSNATMHSQWDEDGGDHSSVAARLALTRGIQEQALAELSQLSYRPDGDNSGSTGGLTRRVRSNVPASSQDNGSQQISRDAAELRERLSAFVSASSRGREEGSSPGPADAGPEPEEPEPIAHDHDQNHAQQSY